MSELSGFIYRCPACKARVNENDQACDICGEGLTPETVLRLKSTRTVAQLPVAAATQPAPKPASTLVTPDVIPLPAATYIPPVSTSTLSTFSSADVPAPDITPSTTDLAHPQPSPVVLPEATENIALSPAEPVSQISLPVLEETQVTPVVVAPVVTEPATKPTLKTKNKVTQTNTRPYKPPTPQPVQKLSVNNTAANAPFQPITKPIPAKPKTQSPPKRNTSGLPSRTPGYSMGLMLGCTVMILGAALLIGLGLMRQATTEARATDSAGSSTPQIKLILAKPELALTASALPTVNLAATLVAPTAVTGLAATLVAPTAVTGDVVAPPLNVEAATATPLPTATPIPPTATATAVPPTATPLPTNTAEPTATAIPPTNTPAAPTPTLVKGDEPVTYEVKTGDICGGIAYRFGVPLKDFLAANNLSATNCLLRIGQVLIIPNKAAAPIKPTATVATTSTLSAANSEKWVVGLVEGRYEGSPRPTNCSEYSDRDPLMKFTFTLQLTNNTGKLLKANDWGVAAFVGSQRVSQVCYFKTEGPTVPELAESKSTSVTFTAFIENNQSVSAIVVGDNVGNSERICVKDAIQVAC